MTNTKSGHLLLAAAIVASLATCGKSEQDVTTTSAASSNTATTQSSSAPGALATDADTTLTVEFTGLIAHLLKLPEPRAVLVRHRDHDGTMQISADRVTEEDLRAIFGSVRCEGDWCTVPLDGWAIQFTSNGSALRQAAVVQAEGTFEKFVPHLAKVTGSSVGPMHKKFGTIAAKARSKNPPAAGAEPISAWVTLPPGTLTATAFDQIARFVPDYEGTSWRQFAHEITLTSSIKQPGIQVANRVEHGEPQWIPVPLHGDGELAVKIANRVPHHTVSLPTEVQASAHFAAYMKLAGQAITESQYRPRIDYQDDAPNPVAMSLAGPSSGAHSKADGIRPVALRYMEVPGCSNSQWP